MDITPLLKTMAEHDASDLLFSAGTPVHIKMQGMTYSLSTKPLNGEQIQKIAYHLMTSERIRDFERDMEMNFGYLLPNVGNYRVNIFRQRGEVAIVIRYIKSVCPSLEDLHMPHTLTELVMARRGLVLIVGSTGSGKSSTLAAMVEYRNQVETGHILTVEDPIEFIFNHKQSVVNQREIGIDTHSYEHALKNAMREAPDVLMIGEIRDKETLQHSLTYAQAGHLCLSTLHANNSYHVLNRIINFFPHDSRTSLLLDLSISLKAVVSQRLVRGVDGKLLPAVEILLNTSRIAELIKTGQTDEIKEAMEKSLCQGSQTFEQSLFDLYRTGKITMEEALTNADSETNLAWIINNAKARETLPDVVADTSFIKKTENSLGNIKLNLDI